MGGTRRINAGNRFPGRKTHFSAKRPKQILPRNERGKMDFNVDRISIQANAFAKAAKPKRKGARLIDMNSLNGLLDEAKSLREKIGSYQQKMAEKKELEGKTPGIISGAKYHRAKGAKNEANRMLVKLDKTIGKLEAVKAQVEKRQK